MLTPYLLPQLAFPCSKVYMVTESAQSHIIMMSSHQWKCLLCYSPHVNNSRKDFSLTYFESDAVMLDKEVRQGRSFLKYILKKQFTEEVDAPQERQIS